MSEHLLLLLFEVRRLHVVHVGEHLLERRLGRRLRVLERLEDLVVVTAAVVMAVARGVGCGLRVDCRLQYYRLGDCGPLLRRTAGPPGAAGPTAVCGLGWADYI